MRQKRAKFIMNCCDRLRFKRKSINLNEELSELFPKITGNKRIFCFRNAFLNFKSPSDSKVSGDKRTLFGIVENSEEVILYLRQPACWIKKFLSFFVTG